MARGGVAAGLVSIPNRYMHSAVEMISLDDIDHAADLLAEFALGIEADADFTPRETYCLTAVTVQAVLLSLRLSWPWISPSWRFNYFAVWNSICPNQMADLWHQTGIGSTSSGS